MAVNELIIYPAIFAVGFLIAYSLVPAVAKLARAIGAVDYPDHRRINSKPTPRAGGLAVFAGTQISILVVVAFPVLVESQAFPQLTWWHPFLAASSILLLVGLLDDACSLKWFVKLCYQALSAAIMFKAGVTVGSLLGYELAPGLDFALTVLWFLAFINAFNLIDGLDGLATGLASVATCGLIGLAVLRAAPGDVMFLVGFLGSLLGFLRFNFHPARIFLGDSGSMFIGFTVATLALATGTKGGTLAAVAAPMLAIGVPVFDTLLAIWRRSLRGWLADNSGLLPVIQSLTTPDTDHLHHRLLQSGLTQRRVAILLYSLNAALVAVLLLSTIFNSYAYGIYLLAFVVASYIVVKHLATPELYQSGTAIMRGINLPSRTALRKALLPAVDLTLLFCAYLVAAGLSRKLSPSDWLATLHTEGAIWASLTFITVFLLSGYNRAWGSAKSLDFVQVGLGCLAGGVATCGIWLLIKDNQIEETAAIATQFSTLAAVCLVALRAIPALTRDYVAAHTPSQESAKELIATEFAKIGAIAQGLVEHSLATPMQKYQYTHAQLKKAQTPLKPEVTSYLIEDKNTTATSERISYPFAANRVP